LNINFKNTPEINDIERIKSDLDPAQNDPLDSEESIFLVIITKNEKYLK